MTALREAAVTYAARDGWHVVPLVGKDPGALLGLQWQTKASCDPAVIERWNWSRATGVGVYLPPSGLICADLDDAEHEAAAAGLGVSFDGGLCARSGRDGVGLHAYFRRPPGMTAEQWGNPRIAGIEFRGNGQQVLPPSRHKSGRTYEWVSQAPEIPLLPEAVVKARRNGGATVDESRHLHLLKVALRAVRSEAAKVDTSDGRVFPQSEIDGLARSAVKYALAGDHPTPAAAPTRNGGGALLDYVSLETVRMRSIEWLEKPLWQRSAFHLLAGVKGSGKGTYTAHLAAKITRGEMGDASNVVFVSSEDSLEVDLKPRLVAAGADCSRVKFIAAAFRLPDDLERLRATLTAIGEVGMVIVDPVSNHIGARNSSDETEVRDAIKGLNELADQLRCLVIGVRHVKKDRSGGALASILGSTAWVDTPRAVLVIARDDQDDTIRHLQVVAGNRSAAGGGVMFQISAVAVDGLDEPVTLATELGESLKDIDELLAPEKRKSSKSAVARDLILDTLEAAPGLSMESDTLDAQVARTTSLAAKTVQNIRGDLRKEGLIKVRPELTDSGQPARWIVYRTGAPR